jgi:glycosyltransferase involved in cell wall biosynthesis
MNLLYITDGDISKVKNASSHFFAMAQALQDLGHRLTIVAPIYALTGGTKQINGLNVRFLPSITKGIVGYAFFQAYQTLYLTWRCLFKRPDAIYARSGFTNFAPLLVAKLFRVPHFMEINGLIEDEFEARGKSRHIINLIQRWNRFALPKATALVAVTEGIKNELNKRKGIPLDRIHVIPNGTDTQRFQSMDKSTSRVALGLETSKKQLGFVGTFRKWQGLHILMEAFKDYPELSEHYDLVLVGDSGDSYEAALRQVVSDNKLTNIQFYGRIDHDDIPSVIATFDICMAPFIRERNEVIGLSPLKLFEYLSCARPVLSTKIPGVQSVIERSCSGWLCEPDSAQSLAETLLEAAKTTDADLSNMGAKGRDYCINHHSWKALATQLVTTIHESV